MTKLDGKTPDLATENIEQLRQIFPDVFEEGKIDFDKLKQVLGEYVDDEKDRYNFTWNGKGKALRLAQTPTTGTLRPCEAESKNWNDTQNLYIEGDNLEVLKLLQKSYHGKIKMIYIDPPYNTGGDFVYPDDFSDSIENYKRITHQVDETGKKLGTNTEASGRYHTDWLNMLYPRLRLARNLLSNDGVIFISIDDNEVENLKKICGEVFGEDNFIAQIVWEKRYTRSNNAKMFASLTDYILLYRKSGRLSELKESRSEKNDSIYTNPDNDPRGKWTSVSYVNPASREQRPNLCYEIINPITGERISHPTNAWKYEYATYLTHVKENLLYWGKNGENTYPRLKKFLSEMDGGIVPANLWYHKDVGTTDAASKKLEELIGRGIFDFPKSVELIIKMLDITTTSDSKVFKLDSSNLKQWQPDYDDLETTLFDNISNYVDGRSELDVVYEIMLKMGMELTWPLETHTIAGKNIYEIGMGALMICLDDHITTEVAEGMAALYKELAPETWRVVFKDNGFADDSAKVNIKEILKTAGLEEDAFTTV